MACGRQVRAAPAYEDAGWLGCASIGSTVGSSVGVGALLPNLGGNAAGLKRGLARRRDQTGL